MQTPSVIDIILNTVIEYLYLERVKIVYVLFKSHALNERKLKYPQKIVWK